MSTERSPVHADRARAESFGPVAEDYDRFRPSYPDELIDDLVALLPRERGAVLDIGCGTGKVAAALAARGVRVLGVEIDPQMAAVARRHGIPVEVGSFEDWDDAGRRFDLATCGQAWHWIDPAAGLRQVVRVLNPGGTLALFWNYARLDAGVRREFDAVYRELAPTIAASATPELFVDEDEPIRAPLERLRSSGLFAEVSAPRYRWERTYTAGEWLAEKATNSVHITLDEPVRATLFAALGNVIEHRGGRLDAHFITYTIFARLPSDS